VTCGFSQIVLDFSWFLSRDQKCKSLNYCINETSKYGKHFTIRFHLLTVNMKYL